jgi:hypothetical protein
MEESGGWFERGVALFEETITEFAGRIANSDPNSIGSCVLASQPFAIEPMRRVL